MTAATHDYANLYRWPAVPVACVPTIRRRMRASVLVPEGDKLPSPHHGQLRPAILSALAAGQSLAGLRPEWGRSVDQTLARLRREGLVQPYQRGAPPALTAAGQELVGVPG